MAVTKSSLEQSLAHFNARERSFSGRTADESLSRRGRRYIHIHRNSGTWRAMANAFSPSVERTGSPYRARSNRDLRGSTKIKIRRAAALSSGDRCDFAGDTSRRSLHIIIDI